MIVSSYVRQSPEICEASAWDIPPLLESSALPSSMKSMRKTTLDINMKTIQSQRSQISMIKPMINMAIDRSWSRDYDFVFRGGFMSLDCV